MAHFLKIIKAHKIKEKWICFQKQKEYTFNEDVIVCASEASKKKTFKGRFKNWFQEKVINKIKTPNTIQHEIWISFLGFLGGAILTYIFFLFFHIAVDLSLRTTTSICGTLGVFFSLGLAFSSKIRCFVLLLLPLFFSRQGRQAILTYALFLAFAGPGKNTINNMEILANSLTCREEMLRKHLGQINGMIKTPYKSIREILQKVMDDMREVLGEMEELLTRIKRIIIDIYSVMENVSTWLESIADLCNKKIGTPFQRCMRSFEDSIVDCKAKLGVMDFLCHVVHIVRTLCYTVKWLDFICWFTEFPSSKVLERVRRQLRGFHKHVKNLFYVSIEYKYAEKFHIPPSNATKEAAKSVVHKFSKRVEKFQTIFSLFGILFIVLLLFLFIKVYSYKVKFLSSDSFDNVYINKCMENLDMKRGKMNRETILPLEPKEKKYYGKTTTFRFLESEKIRMTESIFLLSVTSFKIISFLIIDYGMFWILLSIYEASKEVNEEEGKTKVGVVVKGGGILHSFYKTLGKTLQLPDHQRENPTPPHCIPDPIQPDPGTYIRIGFLVGLSWLLNVTEPYGLRLRNVVMSHYYPDRARERSIWLYNHILQSRNTFVKRTRRDLHRKFSGDTLSAKKNTIKEKLYTSFPLAVFRKSQKNRCLVCEKWERELEPLKRCTTYDCKGKYCLKCFDLLKNACTACQNPIDYGDISDISEEQDSEEEKFSEPRSGDTKYVPDEPTEENSLTFKEIESRVSFKDVEENRRPDLAKIEDLEEDRRLLINKIKEAIHKHIQSAESEKQKICDQQEIEYRQIKLRLKQIVCKIRRKQWEQLKNKKSALRKKFIEKINNLKRCREKKMLENIDENVTLIHKKSEEFTSDKDEASTNTSYTTLKNELKEKVECIRRRRSGSIVSEINSEKSKSKEDEISIEQRSIDLSI